MIAMSAKMDTSLTKPNARNVLPTVKHANTLVITAQAVITTEPPFSKDTNAYISVNTMNIKPQISSVKAVRLVAKNVLQI